MEQENNEEVKIDEEVADWNKPDFIYKPGKHKWIQRGYELHCIGCELLHAVYIGNAKWMVGEENDGTPILKNRIDN